MKQVFIICLTLIVFVTTTYGQNRNREQTIQRIETYLSKLGKAGFDGSVVVEENGEKCISKGFGYSNREKQIKNSPHTIFDIGSITKQFTAAAILKLEMQGKLSTDDKIAGFFNNIPEDKVSITIHDLLRHQSGLVSNVGKDFDKISEAEFLDKVFSSTLKFTPGTNFSYSNIGYSLLAMIIEKVSGTNYETYLYENLWRPAKMETTGYTRPAFDTNLIAVGYYQNDSVWGKPTGKEWDKTAPYWHLKGNGGILSTTEDMYRWHQSLMTDLVLSTQAKQKLYHPGLRAQENKTSYYAYGWFVSRTSRNTTQVSHDGTNRIFYAHFLRYIDENTTLIMLSNQYHPGFNNVNHEISKIIFNPDYKPEIPGTDNKENRDFTTRIIRTIKESGLEKAKTAYKKRKRSEQLLEFMMRNEGFNHIDNNQPGIAMQIFEMNVFVYPKSAKALQGLGEGYMETGKKELALKYLKQSLSMNSENPFVVDLIKKLEQ